MTRQALIDENRRLLDELAEFVAEFEQMAREQRDLVERLTKYSEGLTRPETRVWPPRYHGG